MSAITEAAFADAQEQELHNWEGHTGNSKRLLYELVEHTSSVEKLRKCVRERQHPVEAAVDVGVGCFGLGFLGPHLADLCDRIDGVDPLPRQTLDPEDEALRTYLEAIQNRVNYIQASGESMPFDDATYDLAACINVVDHARDPVAIVTEIHRVLKPGGLFAFSVSTLSKAGEWKWKADRSRHPDKWLYRAHPHTYQWQAADAMVRSLFPDVVWSDQPSAKNQLIGRGRMSAWIVRKG